MTSYKYRNVSDSPQTLDGHGEVRPGDTIESKVEISNPNFELDTKDERKTGVDPVTKLKKRA